MDWASIDTRDVGLPSERLNSFLVLRRFVSNCLQREKAFARPRFGELYGPRGEIGDKSGFQRVPWHQFFVAIFGEQNSRESPLPLGILARSASSSLCV